MLNVFLIVHNFSGVKTYIDELSGYLVSKKDISVYQVYLNCIDLKELTIQKNRKITYIYFPRKINKEYDQKSYKRAAQLIFGYYQNLQNVVFHANMPEQYLFTKEVKELFKCPIVFTFHFLMSFYSSNDKISANGIESPEKGNVLERYMIEAADHIICVTKFAQRTIKKLHKIPTLKTTIIYNGKFFSDGLKEEIQNAKISYGFLPEDRIILYAGQLEPRKGINKLIKAFLLVKDKFPAIKLIVAGSGEFDSYLPLAQECIGRIIFTGNLAKTTLSDFYRFSEIGVIPSQYEQCSYVAIEMMQHRLPLIISDVPGLNELVVHNLTGLVCKIQSHSTIEDTFEVNDEDLAMQIEYLLKNKEERLKLATAAHLEVLKRHSLKIMGQKTLQVYKQLLSVNLNLQ
jgi:glycosyltransferase involved in cell wall biosynthesis